MNILINPHLDEKANFQSLVQPLIGDAPYTIEDIVAFEKDGTNTKAKLRSNGKETTIFWKRITPQRKQLLVLTPSESDVKESLIGAAIVPSPYTLSIDEDKMTVTITYQNDNLLYTGTSTIPLVLSNGENASEGLYKPDGEDDYLAAYIKGRDGEYQDEETTGDDPDEDEDYLAAYLSGRDAPSDTQASGPVATGEPVEVPVYPDIPTYPAPEPLPDGDGVIVIEQPLLR